MDDLTDVRQEELRAELSLAALREVIEDRELEAATLGQAPIAAGPDRISAAEPTLQDALQNGGPLDKELGATPGFWDTVKSAYPADPTFGKVVAKVSDYPNFSMQDGLLYVRTRLGFLCVCIPQGKLGPRALTELAIDHAHRTLGHLGLQKTSEYLRRWVWW
ncbi:uncharacterized protein TRAVEDRAFT_112755, partial [Trametes versicolor FP-101664 SS1]|uniref:uncharacterized protein n=1 Tax=Trametes versicolor (strain FP-101664) TaxID=717944 RepID=UPI0004622194